MDWRRTTLGVLTILFVVGMLTWLIAGLILDFRYVEAARQETGFIRSGPLLKAETAGWRIGLTSLGMMLALTIWEVRAYIRPTQPEESRPPAG